MGKKDKFRFADKHINNRISHNMHLNDKLKVVVANPTFQKQELFEPFDYNARIRYFNTSFPVWADYENNGKWDSEFSKKISELTTTVRKPLIMSKRNITK